MNSLLKKKEGEAHGIHRRGDPDQNRKEHHPASDPDARGEGTENAEPACRNRAVRKGADKSRAGGSLLRVTTLEYVAKRKRQQKHERGPKKKSVGFPETLDEEIGKLKESADVKKSVGDGGIFAGQPRSAVNIANADRNRFNTDFTVGGQTDGKSSNLQQW